MFFVQGATHLHHFLNAKYHELYDSLLDSGEADFVVF
jgi:hypothetical protein